MTISTDRDLYKGSCSFVCVSSTLAVQRVCEDGCDEPKAPTGGDCSDDTLSAGKGNTWQYVLTTKIHTMHGHINYALIGVKVKIITINVSGVTLVEVSLKLFSETFILFLVHFHLTELENPQ